MGGRERWEEDAWRDWGLVDLTREEKAIFSDDDDDDPFSLFFSFRRRKMKNPSISRDVLWTPKEKESK